MIFRRVNTDAGFEIYNNATGQRVLTIAKNIVHNQFENVDYIYYNVFDAAGNYLLEYFDANSPGFIEEVYANGGYNAYNYDQIKQAVNAGYDPTAKAKFLAVTQTMNETGLPYGVAYTITDLSVIDPVNNPPTVTDTPLIDVIPGPIERYTPVNPPIVTDTPQQTTIPIDTPDTDGPVVSIPMPTQPHSDPVMPKDTIPIITIPDESAPPIPIVPPPDVNIYDMPTTRQKKISPLMIGLAVVLGIALLRD